MDPNNIELRCLGKDINELWGRVARLPEGILGDLISKNLVAEITGDKRVCIIHPYAGYLDLNELRLPNDAVVEERFNPVGSRSEEILAFTLKGNNYAIWSFPDGVALLKSHRTYSPGRS